MSYILNNEKNNPPVFGMKVDKGNLSDRDNLQSPEKPKNHKNPEVSEISAGRKPIQICGTDESIFVLCNDGSMWVNYMFEDGRFDNKYIRIPNVPQD